MAGRQLAALVLSDAERRELTSLAGRRNTAQALALRARIVLRCATGKQNKQVAADLQIDQTTVGKWRRRFVEHRMDGLRDEPRPARRARLMTPVLKRDRAHAGKRPAGCDALEFARHGEGLRLVGHLPCSGSGAPSACKPHRLETFKLSTDPDFVAKVRDVVGLYVSPPDHAIVLCVDEKSQIQALDRSQPMLPMRPGQPARRSHDYKRHGTTSLFAALDIATGRVIGKCYARHRAIEFRKFLDEIEVAVPADIDVHLVLDNYATHKAPLIRNWLNRRPRWHVHLTPTSSSWINQVERFFALLTERQIRRGIHRSVVALKAAITTFIDQHNANPKPFRWTKSADDILASIERFCVYNTQLKVQSQ